jgi:hypothetical protein
VLVDPGVITRMKLFRKYIPHSGAQDRVVALSYTTVTRWLRKACVALVLGEAWTTHGLRRGSASEMLRLNIPLPNIMEFGRWASQRSCREYLRKGEVALSRARSAYSDVAWEAARKLAAIGWAIWTQVCVEKCLVIFIDLAVLWVLRYSCSLFGDSLLFAWDCRSSARPHYAESSLLRPESQSCVHL